MADESTQTTEFARVREWLSWHIVRRPDRTTYPPGCTRQVRTLQDTWQTCGGGDPRCPECNPPATYPPVSDGQR